MLSPPSSPRAAALWCYRHTHQELFVGFVSFCAQSIRSTTGNPRVQRKGDTTRDPFVALMSLYVWHITDVHVDPYYAVGSSAATCHCETEATCARMKGCELLDNQTDPTRAEPWGNSEGNCATPQLLYQSAIEFMANFTTTLQQGQDGTEALGNSEARSVNSQDASAALVYFTGDFAEAGATAPCNASDSAQRQVLDIISWDVNTLRATFQEHMQGTRKEDTKSTASADPAVLVFPSLGNHDSVPGDVYVGSDDMQWLYGNMTSTFADVLDDDAKATVQLGGWYALASA